MARPLKQGLDYFPTDCSFYQDIKIRKLIKYNGGVQAVVVYHILLCMIYGKGYYMAWDADIPFYLDEQTHLGEDYILKVIQSAVKLGLFDATMYNDHHVLTSSGIQKRYFAAWLGAKRKLSDELPYLLVSLSSQSKKNKVNSEGNLFSSEETPVNSEETKEDIEETLENSGISTQKKEKERKIKHSSSADIRAREGETAVAVVDEESQVFSSVDEEIVQLRASPIWKEQVLMRFKFLQCNEQTLFEYLDRWGAEVKISGKQHYNLGDAKHHFCNWMIIQEGKLSKTGGNNGTSNNNGYRTSEDILTGAVGIINELRTEGAQPKRKLPVV